LFKIIYNYQIFFFFLWWYPLIIKGLVLKHFEITERLEQPWKHRITLQNLTTMVTFLTMAWFTFMATDQDSGGEIGKAHQPSFLWATYLPYPPCYLWATYLLKSTHRPPTYLPKSYLWSTYLSTHGSFRDYLGSYIGTT
jgi:hypothetical protein